MSDDDHDSLSSQKALLLLIQNYDQSNDAGAGAPLSYLKLGSAKEHDDLDTDAKRGDDLCESAGLSTHSYEDFFIDDGRGEQCEDKGDAHSADYAQHVHYDTEHERADCLDETVIDAGLVYYRSTAKSSATSDKSKTELTAELLGYHGDDLTVTARGGWRDHTDGNRITTVRGDRVDVVYGNYKRVVFGRVSGDHVGPSCYEAAGGHLFERTSTGAMEEYAIERVRETGIDGNEYWKLVEQAHHVDSIFRYSGTHAFHHNGPVHIKTIGVDENDSHKNPEIVRELRYGTVNRTIDADSFAATTEADTLTDTTNGEQAVFGESVVSVVYQRLRGKHDQRHFTYKQELWADVSLESSFFVAKADSMVGASLHDDRPDTYRIQAGIEADALIGGRVKWHYGTKWHIYCSPSSLLRTTHGAALDLDVGMYGRLSFLFWNYAPAQHGTELFGFEVHFLKRADGLVHDKAQALLMGL